MEIWLKHSTSDQILLPVTPEEFHITEKSENTTVVVNSLGEINLLGKRGLKEGSISSFFPNQDYPFAKGDGDDPYDYVDKILEWKEDGTTVRLLIGSDINILISIETFEWGEQDGTGDVYFTLTFKEYREIELKKKPTKKKKNKKKKTKKKKRKSKSKKKQKTYKTKKGDTLRKLAKKFYGDSSKYKKIYNANKGKLKNSQTVPAGITLKIP